MHMLHIWLGEYVEICHSGICMVAWLACCRFVLGYEELIDIQELLYFIRDKWGSLNW